MKNEPQERNFKNEIRKRIHPLCPDCFAVAVIDDNGRLMVKYYEVAGTGFTGMDGRRVRRELGRLVPDWHVKIGIFIE